MFRRIKSFRIFSFIILITLIFTTFSIVHLTTSYRYLAYDFQPRRLEIPLVSDHNFIGAQREMPFKIKEPLEVVMEENLNYLIENLGVNYKQTYSTRKLVFVVTTWRSGSTFFSEMLSSHPAVFYHYEPLGIFGFEDLNEDPRKKSATRILKKLSECNYKDLSEYLQYAKDDKSVFAHNEKIKPGCEYLNKECYSPEYPSLLCQMFPIQLFKIIRMKVSHLETFLKSSDNVHIILLLRDPRAIYASRRKLEWCTEEHFLCMDMEQMCNKIKMDLSAVHSLKVLYPKQIHVVRFEDVAQNPVDEFKQILKYLEIPWHQRVQNCIEDHTRQEIDNPWSTFRISQKIIDKWRNELKTEMVTYVQDRCWPILDNMSYPRIDTTLCTDYCNNAI